MGRLSGARWSSVIESNTLPMHGERREPAAHPLTGQCESGVEFSGWKWVLRLDAGSSESCQLAPDQNGVQFA